MLRCTLSKNRDDTTPSRKPNACYVVHHASRNRDSPTRTMRKPKCASSCSQHRQPSSDPSVSRACTAVVAPQKSMTVNTIKWVPCIGSDSVQNTGSTKRASSKSGRRKAVIARTYFSTKRTTSTTSRVLSSSISSPGYVYGVSCFCLLRLVERERSTGDQ